MEKIIIPFDGSHFSKGALTFAMQLGKLKSLFLSGLFLPEYSGMYWYTGINTIDAPPLMLIPTREDDEAVDDSIRQFREFCVQNGIEHTIHKGIVEYSMNQLIKESRFSDLMIISSERFYPENGSSESSLTDILEESECSVILVPEVFEFPQNIILAYDGSKSSVNAIKQFAYLFPELCGRNTTLVYADKDETHAIPELKYIKEWASHHFSNLTFFSLEADPSAYFETWMMEVKAPLLVSGAYNRSAFSRLLKKSFVENFIRDYKIPLFVSHK